MLTVGTRFSFARRAGIAIGVAVAGLGLFAGGPPAARGVGCENEARREEQHSTYLPGCRAYEQVSPPDKGFANVDEAILGDLKFTPAEDGDSLGFCNATPGGALISAAAYCADYLARRTPEGWSTRVTAPVACGQGQQESAVLGSLDYSIIAQPESASCGVAPLDPAAPVPGKNLYRQSLGPAPAFDLLTPHLGLPASGVTKPFNADNGTYQGASDDADHVVFRSAGDQTEEGLPVNGTQRLYEWDAGQVRLVSRDTANAPLTGASTLGGDPTPMLGPRAGGYGGVSADGSRVYFQNPVDPGNFSCVVTGCELYLRKNGAETVWVSEQECSPACANNASADVFKWADPGGDRALFMTGAKLLNSDPSTASCTVTSGTWSGCDLYMYRDSANPVADGNLTLLSADHEPADGTDASVQGVLGISDDGDVAYFVAQGQLVAGASIDAGAKVYRWDWNGGAPTLQYLARLETGKDGFIWEYGVGTNPRTLIQRVSAGGQHLLLDTVAPLDPVADQDTSRDVYRWSAPSTWSCLSCQTPGDPSAGGSNVWGLSMPINAPDKTQEVGLQDGVSQNSDPIWVSSEDFSRVFFTSMDRLTSADTNNAQDVYEWDEGQIGLISGGRGSAAAKLVGTSLSGDDVFFVTSDPLVGWDADSLRDVYDARVGGGFSEPPPPPPLCGEGECQGPRTSAPPGGCPASRCFEGPGNPQPKPVKCRKGFRKVTVKGRTVCRKVKRPRKHHKHHRSKAHKSGKGR